MTTSITPQRLGSLLRPRSVALVGAADKSGFSQMAFRNLVEFGLGEHTHLVNRRGATAHGRPTVTSCTQIAEPVDVAFMMVPQARTLDALADAAAAGIRHALVLSSGYADAGVAGQRAQADLVAHAESLGILLAGPNHLGFANFIDQIPVTAIPGLPHAAGPVALISQSGMGASAMLDFATKTIALFLETIRDPAVFAAAAHRAALAGKAVVVLKTGRSELSARMAAAHSGAVAGDDHTIDELLHDLGVIRVNSIEDLILTAGAAAHLGRLARPGIGVVSISGGACDMLADHAVDLGAPVPALAAATRAALAGIIPDYGTVQNPLDITGAAVIDPAIFTRCIEVVSADPSVGVVAVINTLPWLADGRPWVGQVLADAVGAGASRARVPVICASQVMQPITGYTRQVMADARIPYAIPGLRHCVAALRNVGWWSEATRRAAGHGDHCDDDQH